MRWLLWLLGGLVVGGLLAMIADYTRLRADNARLRADNTALAGQIDALNTRNAELDAALAARLRRDAALLRRLDTLDRRLKDFRDADPDLAHWLDTPLPGGLGRLHDHPAAEAAATTADGRAR